MHYQKLLLLAIWGGLIGTVSALGRYFPLQKVANPTCVRGVAFEELPEECKIDIQQEGNSEEVSKLLFSALRGTSYEHSQEPDSGGHPSLDIATAAGTPVYAIQDGTVIKAGEIAGYGKSITIKHTIDGETFYSNYSHLRDILIEVGDTVKSGELIGKVGCTGFTISGEKGRCGYHLDFQITTDKSPSHPYGYHDCPGGYYAAVEQGLCRDKMKAYTIDPLLFFNTYAHLDFHIPVIEESSVSHEKVNTETPKKRQSLDTILARLKLQNQNIIHPPVVVDVQKDTDDVDLISSLATSVQVPASPQTIENTPRTAHFNEYIIMRSWNSDPSKLATNKIVTLTIQITDSFGNPVSTTLPEPISVTLSNTDIGSFFPDNFFSILNGKKNLFLETDRVGTAELRFQIGEHILGKETITVK